MYSAEGFTNSHGFSRTLKEQGAELSTHGRVVPGRIRCRTDIGLFVCFEGHRSARVPLSVAPNLGSIVPGVLTAHTLSKHATWLMHEELVALLTRSAKGRCPPMN